MCLWKCFAVCIQCMKNAKFFSHKTFPVYSIRIHINEELYTYYRIRKNIGEKLNLANWRIKIKSPIFYLANLFCTHLTQNLARDPSVVAVI